MTDFRSELGDILIYRVLDCELFCLAGSWNVDFSKVYSRVVEVWRDGALVCKRSSLTSLDDSLPLPVQADDDVWCRFLDSYHLEGSADVTVSVELVESRTVSDLCDLLACAGSGVQISVLSSGAVFSAGSAVLRN